MGIGVYLHRPGGMATCAAQTFGTPIKQAWYLYIGQHFIRTVCFSVVYSCVLPHTAAASLETNHQFPRHKPDGHCFQPLEDVYLITLCDGMLGDFVLCDKHSNSFSLGNE